MFRHMTTFGKSMNLNDVANDKFKIVDLDNLSDYSMSDNGSVNSSQHMSTEQKAAFTLSSRSRWNAV